MRSLQSGRGEGRWDRRTEGCGRKEGRTERCGRTRVALSETVRNRSCDYQSRATEARSELGPPPVVKQQALHTTSGRINRRRIAHTLRRRLAVIARSRFGHISETEWPSEGGCACVRQGECGVSTISDSPHSRADGRLYVCQNRSTASRTPGAELTPFKNRASTLRRLCVIFHAVASRHRLVYKLRGPRIRRASTLTLSFRRTPRRRHAHLPACYQTRCWGARSVSRVCSPHGCTY